MDQTTDIPDEEPSKKRNLKRWAVGTALTVGGLVAAAYVLSRSDSSTGSPSAGGDSAVSDLIDIVRVGVSGHSKQQAYGPNYSLRRVIEIAPYERGVRRAA